MRTGIEYLLFGDNLTSWLDGEKEIISNISYIIWVPIVLDCRKIYKKSNKPGAHWSKYLQVILNVLFLTIFIGVEDDDSTETGDAAPEEEMPPLEGDEDDASRMEEVD